MYYNYGGKNMCKEEKNSWKMYIFCEMIMCLKPVIIDCIIFNRYFAENT